MSLKWEGKEVEFGVWESIWVRDKKILGIISMEVIFKGPELLIEITRDVSIDRKEEICKLSPDASQLQGQEDEEEPAKEAENEFLVKQSENQEQERDPERQMKKMGVTHSVIIMIQVRRGLRNYFQI